MGVPKADAARMAQTCSGDNAAGDPSRSGIVRATAYFNAAAAFNALAASTGSNALCPAPGACSQMALDLLDKSLANQQDSQIRPGSSAAQKTINERYVLRRQLERGRALRGLALSGYASASCGSRSACLTQAANVLASLDVEPAFSAEKEDKDAVRLACDVLDVRWRVNNDIGREREYLYIDDLRRIVQVCPTYAASASDRLAEISFERAEEVRQALVQNGEQVSVDAALGAITNYRDTLSVDRFRLKAYRGMGTVYRALSSMEPASAKSYFANAVDAYENAVKLGSQASAEERAKDLEQLGTSFMGLARLSGRVGSPESLELFGRAGTALQESASLVPTPSRYLSLGEAYAETGDYDKSISAYRSAISNLSGPAKAEASLALADVLDKSGDPTGALLALQEANAQGASSPDVQYEIGRRAFAAGKLNQALISLNPAVDKLGGNRAADAHYMISIAEVALRRADWQQRAFDHAEKAVSLNARTWEYQRQACLANILKGGKAVKNGSNLLRCPDEASPEAKLLRGMYFLKQAQLLDVSAYDLASQTRWRNVLKAAENAFIDGQDALQTARDGERAVWYDDLQTEVDLAKTLEQGLIVVQRCNREITIASDDPVWKALDAFYGYYGVLKCS